MRPGRSYSARELRRAVVWSALLAALVTVGLLDRSCRREGGPPPGPSRSIAPP